MKHARLLTVLLVACSSSNPTGGDAGVDASSDTSVGDGAIPVESGGNDGSAPSAPPAVLVVDQGGAKNDSSSTQELAWQAATAGSSPVAKYKIYRNGTMLATTTALSYSDTSATNSNVLATYAPATSYTYSVSAIDADNNEGPKGYASFYMYQAGGANNGSQDFSYGLTSEDWQDTSGAPNSGAHDVKLVIPAGGGGFQPYTNPTMAPTWAGEIGGFNYFTIDIKITSATNQINLSMLSRPGGVAQGSNDVFGWSGATLVDATGHSAYGTPVVNQWATLKVPLNDLGIGISTFEGYIAGTTLTMTSLKSGPGPDGAAFITGTGVAAGTYISMQPSKGGPFTVNASTNVGSAQNPVLLTSQRTNLYKFDVWKPTEASGTTIYVNNFGWTTN